MTKSSFALLHRLAYCFQHQAFHDVVGVGVGVAAVVAQLLSEAVLLVGKGGVVVDIHDAVGFGVCP